MVIVQNRLNYTLVMLWLQIVLTKQKRRGRYSWRSAGIHVRKICYECWINCMIQTPFQNWESIVKCCRWWYTFVVLVSLDIHPQLFRQTDDSRPRKVVPFCVRFQSQNDKFMHKMRNVPLSRWWHCSSFRAHLSCEFGFFLWREQKLANKYFRFCLVCTLNGIPSAWNCVLLRNKASPVTFHRSFCLLVANVRQHQMESVPCAAINATNIRSLTLQRADTENFYNTLENLNMKIDSKTCIFHINLLDSIFVRWFFALVCFCHLSFKFSTFAST